MRLTSFVFLLCFLVSGSPVDAAVFERDWEDDPSEALGM